MVHIIQKDEPGSEALRKKAIRVPVTDITTPVTQTIIADMKTAMAAQSDGVALAAPQIGHPLRIFVIAGKMFKKGSGEIPRDRVFINPSISRLSRKKESVDEGCLSIRPLYGLVKRSTKATVRAYNEHGEPFEYGASGVLAQIFQHEMDHLSGILFTDKATKTWEHHPEEDHEHEKAK